jgi:5-methylcytosine-specific restriction endonuclease McrA
MRVTTSQNKKCRIGGDSCTPGQLYEDDVCGKHYKRKKTYGTYELLCSVGKEECGPQKRLRDGMCRHHRFYADAAPCIEQDCDMVPTTSANKFVGGRCPTHYQRFRTAQKAAEAGEQVCRVGVDCGVQNKLYEGLCRKHWNLWETYGTFEDPVCMEEDCEVTADTDPSKQFKSGRCNMHYLRFTRALDRARELGLRLCPHCGSDMSTARRNAKYCSVKCTQDASNARNVENIRLRGRIGGALRKAQKLENPGSVPFTVAEWLELAERLEYRCTYCGRVTEPEDLHMDHIVPLHKTSRGPHALYNITPACSGCNTAKKHRPLLIAWAPLLLGGKPRRDKNAPRGKKRNPWVPSDWRDADGPLLCVLEAAQPFPELLRAIQVSEDFYRKRNLSPIELQELETLAGAR